MKSWFYLGLLGLLAILSLGIYLLNKLSTRKANSYDVNANNNFAQSQISDIQNQQNQNHNSH